MKPALKNVLTRSTFTSRFDKKIFENISWSCGNLQNHHDVATTLKGKNPHTITVLNESLKYEYRNRKEYVKKTKIPINSKYRELLYHYFFEEYRENEGNELYGQWLDKYLPLHKKERKYEFVDEYIVKYELEIRYKAQILKRFKNQENLFKKRMRIDRDRLYNLPEPLNYFDWRNPYDNIFVWEENGQKVARRGGSGSSGGRETNSIFIFGLLELNKNQNVPSYLFLYTMENELLFIKRFNSLCVPQYDIGANYDLERSEEEILKQGGTFLRWNLLDEIKEIDIVLE